jgi:uncharacterized membrane protein
MQYRWTHVAEPTRQSWLLKRNCALSPRQLAGCFGALAAVSLGIATAWALQGAWMVVPFACVELGALAVAFVVYARHAADYERIVVEPGRLLVERCVGSALNRVEWERARARVEYRGSGRELIRLVAGRREVSVGQFVPAENREQLARELRASLAAWRA